jgi:hypothetical protein
MNSPQPKHLFKAVQAGDVAGIRELLAAGVSVEATDMNRRTPVMLSAVAGQPEAFRVLVEAGANLHALALDQEDLLECAAEGGNEEIVRFLLAKGLPVDGHWQPRSPFARNQGHLTPLMTAAINGHVEAVRLLLGAGADRNAKFDGETALHRVQETIRFPIIPSQTEKKKQYLEIAALLAEPSDDHEIIRKAAAQEVIKFAENARQPAYERLHEMLTECCGEGRHWQPLPNHGVAAAAVVGFTLRQCDKQRTLDKLQKQGQDAGFHLVLAEPWMPGEIAELVLFPTRDKLAVVTAIGTEGANYGVQTADIIAWLAELDQENPFELRYCAHDLVGGVFRGPVKSAKKWAERIAEVCPSVLEEDVETPAVLARFLSKSKAFVLRWD